MKVLMKFQKYNFFSKVLGKFALIMSFISLLQRHIDPGVIGMYVPMIILLIAANEVSDIILGIVVFYLSFSFVNLESSILLLMLFFVILYYIKQAFKLIIERVHLLSIPHNIFLFLKEILLNILVFMVGKSIVKYVFILDKINLPYEILYILILTMIIFLWYNGYHGDHLFNFILDPLLLVLMIDNLFMTNKSHIINSSFHHIFVSNGGTGITFGLVVTQMFLDGWDKDKFVNSLFNINEEVIFGTPIVENNILGIAFFVSTFLGFLYGYLIILFDIIKPFHYSISWITPPLLKSWIASGGDYKAVLVEGGVLLLSTTIYFIFYLIYKKKKGTR